MKRSFGCRMKNIRLSAPLSFAKELPQGRASLISFQRQLKATLRACNPVFYKKSKEKPQFGAFLHYFTKNIYLFLDKCPKIII
jgi:hypothetical protein